jgi:Fe-S oxidoreductase/nitrate reductase gamma subunit
MHETHSTNPRQAGADAPPTSGQFHVSTAGVWLSLLAGTAISAASVGTVDPDTPHRQVYWNITGGFIVYPFLSMLIAVLLYALWRRSRYWALGRPTIRTDRIAERIKNVLTQGVIAHRVPRDLYAGAYHGMIYSSMVALTIVTTLILIDEEVWTPLTGAPFLQGWFYLGYSLFGDFFGIVGIVGVSMALARRYVRKYRRIVWDQAPEDGIILWGLLFLLVGGFVVEGARIAATELPDRLSWAIWSPGGLVVALILSAFNLGEGGLRAVHQIAWWTHVPAVFLWLGLLAYTKLSHIVMAPTNALFKTLEPYGKLEYASDLVSSQEETNVETFGVGKIQDFTWKQLFELDVCVRCGRCSDNCPAHIAGQPLSPMMIVQNLKTHMNEVGPILVDAKARGDELPEVGQPMVGGAVKEEALWACRTCGACVQECPVYIEHIPTIVDMRRWLVLDKGDVPETAMAALQNIEQRGHPWRGTSFTRTDWMRDMNVPQYDGTQEYLYWVGCTGALVDRALSITQAVVRLLTEAGVSYGVIGAQETCNGDPARRLGNEYLYQMLVQQNVETFNALNVRRVIVHCPHCFNTFKNEYPEFGAKIEVIHHAQLLDHLVKAGRLQPKGGVGQTITFHDSCYLGRHNNIYDEPRDVLSAIPGVKLVEMDRTRTQGLCCGAGGGAIWMEEKEGRRVNHIRAQEAVNTGADAVAVACPFCIQMFEDGIPAVQPDETKRIKAYDISEILELAIVDKPRSRRETAGAGGD